MGHVIDWSAARWSHSCSRLARAARNDELFNGGERRAVAAPADRSAADRDAARRWLGQTAARAEAWRDYLTLSDADAALIERFDRLARELRVGVI